MTIYTNDNTVKKIALRAFPDYKGRTFQLYVSDVPLNCASCWEGGSRTYYKFVRLVDGAVSQEVPAQSMFDKPLIGAEAVTLPEGIVCVEHSIFCGKDMGLRIIVRPENAAGLLPAPVELSLNDKIVLYATAHLKSSYAGDSNIRFHEAQKNTGITQENWDSTRVSLQERRLLDKRGAITADGRNALGSMYNWPKM